MKRQHTSSKRWRSITGGSLVGLGLHILSTNAECVAGRLKNMLDATGGEGLGLLSSLALGASHAAHAYASDHHGFLLFLLRLLLSFWPLLPVIAGTVLLRDVLSDKMEEAKAPVKYFQNKEMRCRFRCPSFDV